MKVLVILLVAAFIQASLGSTTTEGSANATAGVETKAESGGFGSAISGFLSKLGIHLGGSSNNGTKADAEESKAGLEAGASSSAEAAGSGPDSKAAAHSEAEVSSEMDGSKGSSAAESGSEVGVEGSAAAESEAEVSTNAIKSRFYPGRASSQSGALASGYGGGMAASSAKADVYGDDYNGYGRHGGHNGYGGSGAYSNAMAGHGY